MRLTLLGSGDAAGMPRYGCQCQRCAWIRANLEHRRRTSCAMLETGAGRYLIDAGLMDIAERFPSPDLKGILLTHFHADHVQGLFHLRWGCGSRIPVYCPPDSRGCDDLYKHPGILEFNVIKKYKPFELEAITVTPLPLIHSRPTFGYLFDYRGTRLAYLLDTRQLPPRVIHLLRDIRPNIMIIDTTAAPGAENRNHNSLDDSIQLHRQIRPDTTVLTHIGHDLDVWLHTEDHDLPTNVVAGFDGMRFDF